jgi:hypothetical protein
VYACGLANQGQHVQQLTGHARGCTVPYQSFSKELKREFCLFRMHWLAARSNQGYYINNWREAHFAFFKARFQNFECSESFHRTTRYWWSQRHKYLTAADSGAEQESANYEFPDQSRTSGRDPADTVGINSEDIDGEQSEAVGPAFADASAADEDAADAAAHHEARAQAEFLSSEADRAADPAQAAAAAMNAQSRLVSDGASPAAAAAAEGAFRPAALRSAIEKAASCCWHHSHLRMRSCSKGGSRGGAKQWWEHGRVGAGHTVLAAVARAGRQPSLT